MGRPTIKDLATAAGVSISTVNRVIGGGKVRHATMRRVRDAAAAIGFYGLGSIESRVGAAKAKHRFGMLLHQPHRTYYRMLADALVAAGDRFGGADVEIAVEFVDELTPQNIAGRMLALGGACDAIGVVAAVHPLVARAIDALQGRGVPVFALISELEAGGEVPYVGADNWKVGRTAGWAMHRLCKGPGKLGILVGNHRYRCQEQNESGFRSYLREFAPEFALLEPLSTFESSTVAQEVTEGLLREHPDLAGLFVAGGGIAGAMAALRSAGAAGRTVMVGHQLMDNTRAALLDGTMSLAFSVSLDRLADLAVSGMARALDAGARGGGLGAVLPFEICTRENV
ncbi:MAG: LacI family DNA-binding transcriptional regulator [Hyphomicrobiales bacterium]|nr:LacI family DNA-binding transcriptional regulator [Hyphomicrobiales bacterium]MDE2016079.1 LacI family DNA-binding transcriptional regulator [Hyphomicrobiales bacterium]